MSLSTITIVTRLSLGAAARSFFFCIAAKTSFVFIVVVTESSITVSQPANYSVDLCVVSIIFDRSSPPKVACNWCFESDYIRYMLSAKSTILGVSQPFCGHIDLRGSPSYQPLWACQPFVSIVRHRFILSSSEAFFYGHRPCTRCLIRFLPTVLPPHVVVFVDVDRTQWFINRSIVSQSSVLAGFFYKQANNAGAVSQTRTSWFTHPVLFLFFSLFLTLTLPDRFSVFLSRDPSPTYALSSENKNRRRSVSHEARDSPVGASRLELGNQHCRRWKRRSGN